MLDTPEITKACSIAERAHQDQRDKIGDPYIEHPAMVAELVQALPEFQEIEPAAQVDVVVAAWLHDVIEDTAETVESLGRAGVSAAAVEAIVALTRLKDVERDHYYAAIAAKPLALMVKVADIASNLAPHRVERLDPSTRHRLAEKYEHAMAELSVDRSVIARLHSFLPVPHAVPPPA